MNTESLENRVKLLEDELKKVVKCMITMNKIEILNDTLLKSLSNKVEKLEEKNQLLDHMTRTN